MAVSGNDESTSLENPCRCRNDGLIITAPKLKSYVTIENPLSYSTGINNHSSKTSKIGIFSWMELFFWRTTQNQSHSEDVSVLSFCIFDVDCRPNIRGLDLLHTVGVLLLFRIAFCTPRGAGTSSPTVHISWLAIQIRWHSSAVCGLLIKCCWSI